ncbi:hypothetical protein NCAS_0A14490 [Naumovozyma castellii]|uniref:Importin N-terminal domain-containing protein n=1 Tax=Naumovozyma castellii TaxID=27288 RepID=G0V957_NAUCA|nr:hypothetical protein NCAS_0A14490 [Naumovozyma castellii CBS 4309]CCC68007.1 hypothetical protein NCAS_0A14490 [Naumovozyma castellii CBS 4309]
MDEQFLTQLEHTLSSIVQPNSAGLKEATKTLQTQFFTQAASVPALIHILQNNPDDALKQLAGVESRKLISKHWDALDETIKAQIKSSLLQTAFSEPKEIIRHANARVIAAIGSQELETNKWPDLIPNLIQAASGDDATTRQTAIFILFSVLEDFNPALTAYIDDLLNLFAQTINDPASLETRSLSAQALNHVSALIEEQDEINQQQAAKFCSLIPSVVNVLDAAIKADDTDNAKLLFNCFNDFLLLDSQLTGNTIADLIKLNLQIAVNTSIDEEIRVFAVQFITSALSYRKSKVSQSKLGPEITLAALKIAAEEIDVDDELNNEEEVCRKRENTPSLTAIRLLAFASSELPPSQVATVIVEHLPTMLQSTNPFERRAILLAISVAVTGSPDYILSQFDKIIPAAIAGLKDPEPVVKLAALKCVSHLTTDLQDEVAKFHEQFLPLIIDIIDTAKFVVIYNYATVALDGLLEFIAYDAIAKYLEPLMNKLFYMLENNNSSKLRCAIVSAIGSAAFAAGTAFIPYFKPSVQYLEKFIQNCSHIEGMSEDDIELRAITFENISTMARAVRSDTFAEFADPLVKAAYDAIKTDSARLRESGYAFIANLAKVYGENFSSFLETVIPEIFKTLQLDEYQFNFDEEELEALSGGVNEEELANKFTVNTGISYEKEVAAAALSELALGTKQHFLPYVEESMKVLNQQVDESYGLRETALNTIWSIVKAVLLAAKVEPEKYPKGIPTGSYVDASALAIIQSARETAINNLTDEFETSMVITILEDFANMIKQFGSIIIMDNGDSTMLETLCLQVSQVLAGTHACQTIDMEEDVPKDEELDASETEATLQDVALEVLVSLSHALAGDFAKIFETFKPLLFKLFESKSKNKRSSAVGAASELALGMKESNPFIHEMMEALVIRLTTDKSLEVRGNAAYGVGLLCQYAPFDVSAIYGPVLKAMYELLSTADQKALASEDDEATREIIDRAFANATGCVARMTLKHETLVPVEQTLPALLAHLPLNTGFEEYNPIFELIMKLYQEGNAIIVKETPKVVEVLATVFTKEQERIKLEQESTLGREENMDRLKQFQTEEMKLKVIELLKYLNTTYNGIVAQNPVLAGVIA